MLFGLKEERPPHDEYFQSDMEVVRREAVERFKLPHGAALYAMRQVGAAVEAKVEAGPRAYGAKPPKKLCSSR